MSAPDLDRARLFASALTGGLERYTEAARVAFAEIGREPGRVLALAPGESVAWDDCCRGQLWTRLTSLTPAESATPARRSGLDVCAVPHFIATVELGILRCATVGTERKPVPAVAPIVAEGEGGIDDMTVLLSVLSCLPTTRGILGGWTPRGPEGGCVGGHWTFTMRIENCLDCLPDEPAPGPSQDPAP